MIEPIRLAFDVACPQDHAFAVWTAGIDRWWPADHTITATNDLFVVFEPRPGGRIFERTPGGVEHDWGEVTVWEPPNRLGYLWHLRRDRADATEVEIRFVAAGEGTTRIEIEHRGWEALGADGETWRDRNHGGWATLLPSYIAVAEDPMASITNTSVRRSDNCQVSAVWHAAPAPDRRARCAIVHRSRMTPPGGPLSQCRHASAGPSTHRPATLFARLDRVSPEGPAVHRSANPTSGRRSPRSTSRRAPAELD